MKVLHIGLLSYFTDGMLYQENLLTKCNLLDGHDTIFITNNAYYNNGVIAETDEEDIILSTGVRLIRLKYDNLGFKLLTNKIQKVSKLLPLVKKIKPDIILWHGCCGYELINIAKYIKNNLNAVLYIDSHEDFHNTARNCISKFIYKYIHGYFLEKAMPWAKKVLPITYESKCYLKEMYNIPEDKMEIFPLGGEIIPIEKQNEERIKLISQYNLRDDSIIFAHSGKMNKYKCTKELIEAFKQVSNERMVLFIFGSIPDEQRDILIPLINSNNRIYFIGWKKNEEIIDMLAATDVYCQPGSCSATLQVALCAGCAAIVYSYDSYINLCQDNVLYCKREVNDIKRIFEDISLGKVNLKEYKEKAYNLAKEKLDYRILARRYLV